MKKKNILFVHSSDNLAGGERVTELLFDGFKNDRNYSLFLLHSRENTKFSELAHYYNVVPIPTDFHEVSLNGLNKLIPGVLELCRLLKKNKINIIHVVDPIGYRYVSIPALICRVPILFHHHFPYSHAALTWFYKNLKKPQFHAFCCQSILSPNIAFFENQNPKPLLQVVHNGIDTKKFTYTPKRIENVTNIGILGNFQKRKGHEDFIEVAATLSKLNLNFTFHIFGQEEEGSGREQALRAMIEEKGLTENFVFHGFVDKPQKALQELHILICASRKEAFPMNILEAMAKGVSVVTTNVDGIPEAVKDSYSGFINEVGDIEKTAENVTKLVFNSDLRKKMLSNARKEIEENFSKEVFVRKFEEVYRSI